MQEAGETGTKKKTKHTKTAEGTETKAEKTETKPEKRKKNSKEDEEGTTNHTKGEDTNRKKKKKKQKHQVTTTTTITEIDKPKEDLIEDKKKQKTKKKHDQSSLSQGDKPPATNSLDHTNSHDTSTPTLIAEKRENQSDLNHPPPKSKKKEKKEKKIEKSTNPSPDASSAPIPTSVAPKEVDEFISSNQLTYEPPEILSQLPPVLKFEDVQVHNSLRKAFATFQKPSPIQSAVWPVLIAGRDVVGIAETGSGKTLAFGIPALQHILNTSSNKTNKSNSAVNVLIIAPTRELAMQTETTLCEVGKLTSPPIKTLCVYGGVDKFTQRKALANSGVLIVVGTPGRLLDLANEGNLKLDQVSWLILDEADRMLDKGFENDIRAIINLCLPSQARLTTMFSATWPTSVRRLAADFMKEPVRIIVGADELTASCSVEQTVEVLEESRGKEWKLLSTLQALNNSKNKSNGSASQKDKIIVFALYKKEAQRLYEFLLRKNYQACCIEGNMSQDKRSKSLDDFMTGKATILVATDVAARGLDIPKVEFVINVTFPLTIEDYIHRIGRTGRAGRTGKSITFFTDEDKAHAGELMKVLKDAGQVVPEALKQWGGQIKKKTHAAYGDHWKEVDLTVKAKKITFD